MRENRNYNPGNETVKHIEAVLQLLNVMDKEKRFEEKINEEVAEGKVKTMSEWLDKVIKTSEANGESKGRKEGENRMGKLMKILLKQGRTEDLDRAVDDSEFRNQLFQEFQIG